MKTKNLITLSLLILIIGLGSYTIFNKQKKGIITETTTTKLALCSNQYYKTKYDTDGKIIIDGWSTCVDTNPSDEEIEAGNATSHGPYCESNKVSHIRDLTCVQRLDLSGIMDANSFNTFPSKKNGIIDPENNPRDIASLINLEELNLSVSNIDAEDAGFVLPSLNKLKSLDLSYTPTQDISVSVFSNLVQLDNLIYNYPVAITYPEKISYSQKLCDIVKVVPSLRTLNNISINSSGFDCSQFIKEMSD